MKRITLLLLSLMLIVASCKDRVVCPAFQSSYILDDEKQKERFSFFKKDSLILEANAGSYEKDLYGLTEREYGYWQNQKILTVTQKDVYSDEVDSLLDKRREKPLEMAESGVDSLMAQNADSLQYGEGEDQWDNTKRFHYNVEFVKYMLLVGNDVLLRQAAARDSAQAKQDREDPAVQEGSSDKKGGFLKNLFGGKKKGDQKEDDQDSEEEAADEATE